jgi:DNA-binding MarR family transcriptional regulator
LAASLVRRVGMTDDRFPLSAREEWLLLYAASAILRKESERALAPLGITFPQGFVLATLADVKTPLPVSKLAMFLLQESPSVTALVDRMSERGLVERGVDPHDRRKVLVSLTDRGRQVLKDIKRPAREVQDEMFSVLSDRERATLKRILRKFRRSNIQRLGS